MTTTEALKQKKYADLVDLLKQLPRKKQQDGILAEDVLRDIRKERTRAM